MVLATTSTLTAASSTFVFNATTTGKSIQSPNAVTFNSCLLYTSDAADERSSVDLGGRRIIKKNTQTTQQPELNKQNKKYQEINTRRNK